MLVNTIKERKIFAKDMNRAMRILSDNLGSNAVIVSSKKVTGGVEIIGIADNENILDFNNNKFSKDFEGKKINSYLSPNHQLLADSFLKNDFLFRLQRMGICENISKDLIEKIFSKKFSTNFDTDLQMRESYWKKCVKVLGDMIPVEVEDPLKEGGIFSFYGPKAAGKSATIAKLAIRWYLKSGRDSVAIISNCKNNNLIERISIMTGIRVFFTGRDSSMSSCLKKCANYRLVLIDMPDSSNSISSLFTSLKDTSADIPLKNFLVLSASGDKQYLNKSVLQYGNINFSGCILTRIDQTLEIGGLVSFLIEKNMNISFLCNGELLPKQINLPTKKFLFESFFSKSNNNNRTFNLKDVIFEK